LIVFMSLRGIVVSAGTVSVDSVDTDGGFACGLWGKPYWKGMMTAMTKTIAKM
jgi:hypothetical protein